MAIDKYFKAVYTTKQKHPKVGRSGEKFELVFYIASPKKGLVRELGNKLLTDQGEVIDHFLAPAVDEVDKIEYEANQPLDSSVTDHDAVESELEQDKPDQDKPATTKPANSNPTGKGIIPIKFNQLEDRGFTYDAVIFISVATWYRNDCHIDDLTQPDINYINSQTMRLPALDSLSTYCAVICSLIEPRYQDVDDGEVIDICRAVYGEWSTKMPIDAINDAFLAGAEQFEMMNLTLDENEMNFARSRLGLPLPALAGDHVEDIETTAPVQETDNEKNDVLEENQIDMVAPDDFFASMGINLDFDAAPTAEKEQPAEEPVVTIAEQIDQLNAKLESLKHGESLIIDDLPNAVYHGANGYSKSSLDLVKRDPALLEWSRNAPVDEENQNANDVGSATHALILEPHLFDDEYIISPVFDRRTKQGKADAAAFAEKNKHLTIIDSEDGRKMALMSASVHAHPLADRLLNAESGIAEQSIFWREPSTGFIFKIRPDYQCKFQDMTFIIDLKTSAKIWQFETSVADYRYHVQDAFYSWVFSHATGTNPIFAFLVVSKSVECGKYPVRLCQLTDEDKSAGNVEFNRQIQTIKDCSDKNVWGGFESITRPFWAKRND